jgi:hypothetical protein
MNKSIFVVFFGFLLHSNDVKADQLALIPLTDAKSAVEYLRAHTQVVLWCACCNSDAMLNVEILSVYYKHAGEDLYQVFLVGTDDYGNRVEEALDFAYVHIQIGEFCHALGVAMGLKCDPCTSPFKFY